MTSAICLSSTMHSSIDTLPSSFTSQSLNALRNRPQPRRQKLPPTAQFFNLLGHALHRRAHFLVVLRCLQQDSLVMMLSSNDLTET